MKEIWIVDDDEEMSHAIELMLQLINYNARIFLDARPAAKELLAGVLPDLIILDINMPAVSGLDLLEFIRRRKEFEKIPVVMLSTEAAETVVDKSLWMGADAYVTKPVAVEELDEAIRKGFKAHGVEN
jgi:DNA-binding response OmpR family regulator